VADEGWSILFILSENPSRACGEGVREEEIDLNEYFR
jgi:hypothetical protein